jgi:hypothetical protein
VSYSMRLYLVIEFFDDLTRHNVAELRGIWASLGALNAAEPVRDRTGKGYKGKRNKCAFLSDDSSF